MKLVAFFAFLTISFAFHAFSLCGEIALAGSVDFLSKGFLNCNESFYELRFEACIDLTIEFSFYFELSISFGTNERLLENCRPINFNEFFFVLRISGLKTLGRFE